MTFPSIFLALLIGWLVVVAVLAVHRRRVRGTKMTSLSLLARLSSMGYYMLFAALATSLLCVLLSGPAAFADGMFRVVTGASLPRTLSGPHLLLAFVVLLFAAAAAGFFIVRVRAESSRPLRRLLRGMPRSENLRNSTPARYPPPPPRGRFGRF